jgi:IS30 family transposase
MAFKHFSFDDRVFLQENLDKGIVVHRIAQDLDRPDSSVIREIQRNRFRISGKGYSITECDNLRSCSTYHGCGDEDCSQNCVHCYRICGSDRCPDYREAECPRITKSPYVCNGCDKYIHHQVCRYPQYIYNAKRADAAYHDTLRSSRSGIALSPEALEKIDKIVSPLLQAGQSIPVIYFSHAEEIPCSIRTLYNYVDDCYLTARNIDMPRKVRFKPRYSHGDSRNREAFAVGRSYTDFQKYIEAHPYANICEMDTVIGARGGKVLLTLLLRSCSLLIAFLLPDKSADSVIQSLNDLSDALGIELFRETFGVILTDRGTEFSNPYALECDRWGEIKTRVFYCDAYQSNQKGMIERNHEFIRYVLPSGSSFDGLSQADITLLMNHINNYPRESLNGQSPYALANLLVKEKVLRVLKYHKIRPDDVILKPFLLRK